MTTRRSLLPEPAAVAIVALCGALIAVLAPFERTVSALTAGSAPGSAILLACLTLLGAAAAARLGLRLRGHGAKRPFLVGLTAAAAVAAYCLAIDCWALPQQVDPGLARFLHEPLGERLLYFMPRAFNENVIYRLFLFPLLALGLASLMGQHRPPFAIQFIAMIAAQMVNIGINVIALSPHQPTFASLVHDALRYVVPGVIWALLFRRYGFATAEVASVGCHLFLQPGYSVLL